MGTGPVSRIARRYAPAAMKAAAAVSNAVVVNKYVFHGREEYAKFQGARAGQPVALVKVAFVAKVASDVGVPLPRLDAAVLVNDVKTAAKEGPAAAAKVAARGALGMATGGNSEKLINAAGAVCVDATGGSEGNYLGSDVACMVRAGHARYYREEEKLKAEQAQGRRKFEAQEKANREAFEADYAARAHRYNNDPALRQQSEQARDAHLEACFAADRLNSKETRANAQLLGAAYATSPERRKSFILHEAQKGSNMDTVCPDPVPGQIRASLAAASAHIQARDG